MKSEVWRSVFHSFGGRSFAVARFLLAAVLGLAAQLSPARGNGAKLVAFGEIPATAKDQLGDTLGGLGSAVAYDARTGDIFMMPDRGAGDGTLPYRPRFFHLRVTRTGPTLHVKLLETVLFRDERGRPFTGLIPDGGMIPTRGGQRCLDPEALALAPDGSLYVTDEYTPALLHFSRGGRLLRTFPLPAWYRPHDDRGRPLAFGSKLRARSGRTENQGPEAMGILPGGKRAVLILQSALAQDGGKPAGITRILILDLTTGDPISEYAYAFTDPRPWNPRLRFRDLSINDLAVLDKHRLLVLERDGDGRDGPLKSTTAHYKSVWVVDFSSATDLLALPGRPYQQLPSAKGFQRLERRSPVKFASKKLLFNLPDLTSQLGIPVKSLAAKWEGLALLPSPSPRRHRLLMTADNDFLDPEPILDGTRHRFPRAVDTVPTQLFEILAPGR